MIKLNYGTTSKLWMVDGSKGRRYMVKFNPDEAGGAKWQCFCAGYKHRNKCKHIKEKQREVLSEQGYEERTITTYLQQWS